MARVLVGLQGSRVDTCLSDLSTLSKVVVAEGALLSLGRGERIKVLRAWEVDWLAGGGTLLRQEHGDVVD